MRHTVKLAVWHFIYRSIGYLLYLISAMNNVVLPIVCKVFSKARYFSIKLGW